MSSRHIRRIGHLVTSSKNSTLSVKDVCNDSKGNDNDDDDDSDDGDDEVVQFNAKFKSAFNNSSSDSSSSSDSDSDSSSEEVGDEDDVIIVKSKSYIHNKNSNNRRNNNGSNKKKKTTAAATISDTHTPKDDNDIDAIIEDMKIIDSNSSSAASTHKYVDTDVNWEKELLYVSGTLDIDSILRKRFAGGMDATQQQRGNKKKQVMKRLLFGNSQDDWVRPPQLIAGGMSIEKRKVPSSTNTTAATATANTAGNKLVEVWYDLVYSEEYEFKSHHYELVKGTGDCNRLYLFVVQNPYHVEALLNLAMLYVRVGNIDLGHRLIKRIIFILEYSFNDSFKLNNYHNDSNRVCRIDANSDDYRNEILFMSLFRHMQLAGIAGCPTLASDIGKVILSLDPRGDPLYVYLLLDHFLVAADKHKDILALLGISRRNLTTSASGDANDDGDVGGGTSSRYRLEDLYESRSPFAIGSSSSARKASSTDNGMLVTLSDFPNWRWSVAVACYLNISSTAKATAAVTASNVGDYDDVVDPTTLIHYCLITSPYMLLPILTKAGVKTASLPWSKVLAHNYFAMSKSYGHSLFDHIADCYSTRNASIWSRDNVLSWLLTNVTSFLAVYDSVNDSTATTATSRFYISNSIQSMQEIICETLPFDRYFKRYADAPIDDMKEEFQRLPAEANPLNNELANPELLETPNGANAFPPRVYLQGLMDQQNRNNNLANRRGQMERQADAAADDGVVADNDDAVGGDVPAAAVNDTAVASRATGMLSTDVRLDLTAPLMQLLWQSLLPWYNI